MKKDTSTRDTVLWAIWLIGLVVAMTVCSGCVSAQKNSIVKKNNITISPEGAYSDTSTYEDHSKGFSTSPFWTGLGKGLGMVVGATYHPYGAPPPVMEVQTWGPPAFHYERRITRSGGGGYYPPYPPPGQWKDFNPTPSPNHHR